MKIEDITTPAEETCRLDNYRQLYQQLPESETRMTDLQLLAPTLDTFSDDQLLIEIKKRRDQRLLEATARAAHAEIQLALMNESLDQFHAACKDLGVTAFTREEAVKSGRPLLDDILIMAREREQDRKLLTKVGQLFYPEYQYPDGGVGIISMIEAWLEDRRVSFHQE